MYQCPGTISRQAMMYLLTNGFFFSRYKLPTPSEMVHGLQALAFAPADENETNGMLRFSEWPVGSA